MATALDRRRRPRPWPSSPLPAHKGAANRKWSRQPAQTRTSAFAASCNRNLRGKRTDGRRTDGRGARRSGARPLGSTRLLRLLLCSLPLLLPVQLAASEHDEGESDSNWVIIKTSQGQAFKGVRLRAAESGGPALETANQNQVDSDKDVLAFLGIRYASAPVERLRFMPPTPFSYTKAPAAGGNQAERRVHDMREFGPICMQKFPLDLMRERPDSAGESDDERLDRTNEAAADPGSGPSFVGANRRSNRTGAKLLSASKETRLELQLDLMERILSAEANRGARSLVRKLASEFVQSEDCLNLNIYTPAEAVPPQSGQRGSRRPSRQTGRLADDEEADAGRPVLVVVHGDSFDYGSGSVLSGRKLAHSGRLVVITLNYRLNILGFPPKLAGAARGNLGLLDQLAALHWIRANVRSFGGSPKRVTLMGLRGGAIFVHLLMLSPMAKGLFQRAVLEDGTALTPVIANAIAAHSPGSGLRGPAQQVAALQHVRLLAHICRCPSAASESADERQAPAQAVFECLKAKPAKLITQHLPVSLVDFKRLGSAQLGAAIPIAAKWMRPLDEALDLMLKEQEEQGARQAGPGRPDSRPPSDLSSQPSKLEELRRDLLNASGAPAISAPRLVELVALLSDRFRERKSPVERGSARLSALLSELMGAIYLPAEEALPIGPVFAPQLEQGTILGGQLGAAGAENGASSTGSSASAAAPSGVRDELDLASAMLARGSPFHSRDLLVGLSRPLVPPMQAAQATLSTTTAPASQTGGSPGHELGLERPLWWSRRAAETGLSEEQAIGQVNLFVRSFYRFHQQEISNSILSQYLARGQAQLTPDAPGPAGGGGGQLRRRLLLAESLRELYSDALIQVPLLKTALIHSLQQLDSLADLFVAQQLNKLSERAAASPNEIERFEQSLLDAISTRKPHSDNESELTSESETETFEADSAPLNVSDSGGRQAGAGARKRRLHEELFKFARSLYNSPLAWPIELANASALTHELYEQKQPHSTFVYQFGGSLGAPGRLPLLAAALKSAAENSEPLGRVRTTLASLSEEVAQAAASGGGALEWASAVSSGFACALSEKESPPATAVGDGPDLESRRDSSKRPAESSADPKASQSIVIPEFLLLGRFFGLICQRRVGRALASFVETGNVNVRPGKLQAAQTEPPVGALRRRYERSCEPLRVPKKLARGVPRPDKGVATDDDDDNNADDHHLVRLNGGGDLTAAALPPPSTQSETSACARLREQLAFELALEVVSDEPVAEWPVFSVFGQQLASLLDWPAPAQAASEADRAAVRTRARGALRSWSVQSFVERASSGQLQKEALDERLSFWANFVPALNCSRTQPIGAGSLTLFAQLNSSLLNMNLDFGCQPPAALQQKQQQQQQQQTATASSLIRAMERRIELELARHISSMRRTRARANNASNQTARGQSVANLSSSETLEHALGVAPESGPTGHDFILADSSAAATASESRSLAARLLAAFTGAGATPTWDGQGLRARPPTQQQRAIVHFWLLIGASALLVGSALFVGAFVALKQCKRGQKQRQVVGQSKMANGDLNQRRPLESSLASLNASLGCLDVEATEGTGPGPAPGKQLADGPQQPVARQHFGPASQADYQAFAAAARHHPLPAPPMAPQILDAHYLRTDFYAASPCDHRDLNLVSDSPLVAPRATSFLDDDTPSSHAAGRHQLQTSFSSLATAALGAGHTNGDPNPHHNRLLFREQHQQHALSSSSETTTTGQRAQSSVSLISNNGTLGQGQGGRRPAKKRVQISDPKRRLACELELREDEAALCQTPLEGQFLSEFVIGGELDGQGAARLRQDPHDELNNDAGAGALASSFCPIHRANSNFEAATIGRRRPRRRKLSSADDQAVELNGEDRDDGEEDEGDSLARRTCSLNRRSISSMSGPSNGQLATFTLDLGNKVNSSTGTGTSNNTGQLLEYLVADSRGQPVCPAHSFERQQLVIMAPAQERFYHRRRPTGARDEASGFGRPAKENTS